jgi:ABC-type nitrate/sulfonate/bicarbonate transport system permease component
MYVYVVVTGVLGVDINIAARAIERAVMPWHSSLRTESLS